MKRILSLMLALLLAAGCLPAQAESATVQAVLDLIDSLPAGERAQVYAAIDQRRAAGHDTPEAALGALLDGLKAADLAQMYSAFAVETYAAHATLETFLSANGYWTFSASPLPTTSPLYVEFNTMQRASQVVNQLCLMLLTLHDPARDWIAPQVANPERDPDAYNALMEALSTDRLAGLADMSEVQFHSAEAFLAAHSPGQADTWADVAQRVIPHRLMVTGADDFRSLTATFRYNGETWVLFADAVCYDGRWYLYNMPGMLGSMLAVPSSSPAVPLSMLD